MLAGADLMFLHSDEFDMTVCISTKTSQKD